MGMPYPKLRKIISSAASTLSRLVSEQLQCPSQTVAIAGATGMILCSPDWPRTNLGGKSS